MTTILGRSAPVIFNDIVPPLTRMTLQSDLIDWPFEIDIVRVAFALNTGRTLEIRLWVADAGSVPNNVAPTGISVLAGRGASDYVVGDGAEGELVIPIGKRFPGRRYLLCDANNTDVFQHTIDVRADLQLDRHEWSRFG